MIEGLLCCKTYNYCVDVIYMMYKRKCLWKEKTYRIQIEESSFYLVPVCIDEASGAKVFYLRFYFMGYTAFKLSSD